METIKVHFECMEHRIYVTDISKHIASISKEQTDYISVYSVMFYLTNLSEAQTIASNDIMIKEW